MRRTEAIVFVVAAYALLFFAHLLPQRWESPSTTYAAVAWCAFMFRVFEFHIGLTLCVILLASFLKKRWRFAAALLPILLYTVGPEALSMLRTPADQARPDDITVVSCNLLMVNNTTAPMLDVIAATHPDIIFFQEYTDRWHVAIRARLASELPFAVFYPCEDSFGAAIYSRYPFTEAPTKSLPMGSASVPQMRATVEIANTKIALYNIHLLPPLRRSYIMENRQQFGDLLQIIQNESLPTILAGDFNATERSPNAGDLAALGLRDAYDEAGSGRGATWPAIGLMRGLPGLRLDHVYLSESLQCTSARVTTGPGSDHRLTIADIRLIRD
ncbi:MAG: endonuclease/exonuclease/phosphatase family protein [Phycisphaerales bacterium]|nr:endonuclease/exonuclease/phosphatase family protein [Phycisphaerales bacterium]